MRIIGGRCFDADAGLRTPSDSEAECDDFLRRAEEHFAAKRFTNAADAFDTVKAWAQGNR